MASDTARKKHDELFAGQTSTLAVTDPVLILEQIHTSAANVELPALNALAAVNETAPASERGPA